MSFLPIYKLNKRLVNCWESATQSRAYFFKKYERKSILEMNIITLSDDIIKAFEEKLINLYLSITLSFGVIKIYQYKVEIILDDCIQYNKSNQNEIKKTKDFDNFKTQLSIETELPNVDLEAIFKKKDNTNNLKNITIQEVEVIRSDFEKWSLFGDECIVNNELLDLFRDFFPNKKVPEQSVIEPTETTANVTIDITTNIQDGCEFTFNDETYIRDIGNDTEGRISQGDRKRKSFSMNDDIPPVKCGKSNGSMDVVSEVMVEDHLEKTPLNTQEKIQISNSLTSGDTSGGTSQETRLFNNVTEEVTRRVRKLKRKSLKITRRPRPIKKCKEKELFHFFPKKIPYKVTYLFTPLLCDDSADVDFNLENAIHFEDLDKHIDFELDFEADDFFQMEISSIIKKFENQELAGDNVHDVVESENNVHQTTMQPHSEIDSFVLREKSIDNRDISHAIENINLKDRETLTTTLMDSFEQPTLFNIGNEYIPEPMDYAITRLTMDDVHRSEPKIDLQQSKIDSPVSTPRDADKLLEELNNALLETEVITFQELFPSETISNSRRFIQFKHVLYLDNKRKIVANQREPYGLIEIRKI